jgi:hypothetical protein
MGYPMTPRPIKAMRLREESGADEGVDAESVMPGSIYYQKYDKAGILNDRKGYNDDR